MASYIFRRNGLTATGPTLLTRSYESAGHIIYVNSATGSNANTGLLEDKPKANVFGSSGVNAYQAATTGEDALIVCRSGHSEVIDGAWDGAAGRTWSKTEITLVGEGTGSAMAKFVSNTANAITISGNMTRFNNLWFGASTAASTNRIEVSTGLGVEFKDCKFDIGANDATYTLLLDNGTGDYPRIVGCSFTVVAAGGASGLTLGAQIDGVLVEDCTFDGGAFGWATSALLVTSNLVGGRIINLTLSNQSFLEFQGTRTPYVSGTTIDDTSGIIYPV